MVSRIWRGAALLIMIAALCGVCYELGKSRAKVKIVEKRVEVAKYVEKKRAQIHARPNANRDVLLERMRRGKL